MSESEKKTPFGYSLGPDYASAPKGFPHKVEFIEIDALTPEQELLRLRIQEAREASKTIKTELEAALEACKHPVFNDRDGFIYITRHCLICDAHIDDV